MSKVTFTFRFICYANTPKMSNVIQTFIKYKKLLKTLSMHVDIIVLKIYSFKYYKKTIKI